MSEAADIIEFTAEDFTSSPAPYEYLYGLRDRPFVQGQEVVRLEKAARVLQVYTSFRRLWKAYQVSMDGSKQAMIRSNVTEFPDPPDGMVLKCENYECNEFGVSIDDPFRGEVTVCPHPIMPVRRIINLDSGDCKTEIAFLRGNFWRKAIFEKRILASAQKIVDISSCGIAVDSENARQMVSYLSLMENLNYDVLPEAKSIGRLGWVKDYGFSPYVEELEFDGNEQYRHAFESVKRAGSFDKWTDCMRAMRSGPSVAARIMLAASFASVLVGPLNAQPFIVHCWSNVSGIGKTIALMAAGSVWANPQTGEYLKTFNSTNVGIEMMAGFFGSMPLCMDELCLKDGKRDAFESMIYQYCEGVGRTRGAKNGGLQRVLTWRNCMISNGEEPLTSGNSRAGAVNRVLDINCGDTKMFGDDRGTLAVITSNYGHAGPAFIASLTGKALETIQRMQEAFFAQMEGKTTDKQRLAASIILAADAWAEMVIFQDNRALTAEEIIPFLQSEESTNVNARAYDFLMDTISANPARFEQREDGTYSGECWGMVDQATGQAYIIKSIFDRIMKDEGYNSTGFLNWAKHEKLLSVEGGPQSRLTKKKRIPGLASPARCVCIRMDGEERDPESGYEIVQEDFPM